MKQVNYNGNVIALDNNTLFFNGKSVKVIENRKYTYKLNKTCIAAEGSAAGLYAFVARCINDKFGLVWIDAITSHMETLTEGSINND